MPSRSNRRKPRARANEAAPTKNWKARELWKWRVCGKSGKPKALPTLSTSPLEISPKAGEVSTFPQLRRRRRMEKWKTKSRFSTFPPPRVLLSQTKKAAPRAGFALRPAAGAPRRPKRQDVIVVDKE